MDIQQKNYMQEAFEEAQRMLTETPSTPALGETSTIPLHRARSGRVTPLERIADSLERIAAALEQYNPFGSVDLE